MKNKIEKLKIIETLDELKELAQKENGVSVRLLLNGGAFSRKDIYFINDRWKIENHIDGSTQRIKSDKELGTQTHIIEGIRKHALVAELDI